MKNQQLISKIENLSEKRNGNYRLKICNLCLVFITTFFNVGFLIAQDSLLLEKITANTYHLKLENNRLTGSGASIINQAINESQFLLVGEQHGIQEVSKFTSGLFLEAVPFGYDYLCIETDPYNASKLEALAKTKDDAIVYFLEKYPQSIPFYDAKEEFQLIQNVLNHSNKTDSVIWGVDQVLITMPRYLFSLLEKEAPTENVKQIVTEYYNRAVKQYEISAKTKNPQDLMLITLKNTDFEKLYKTFGSDISISAKRILEDMQTTRKIYMHYLNGEQYENNRVRSQLMKKQFMEYYNQTKLEGKLPKVVLKFGANHAFRGITPVFQYDLGNMVYELAEMNETKAVSFHLSAVKGQARGYDQEAQSFDFSEDLNPIIKKVLTNKIIDDGWVIIDMRSLRTKLDKDELEKIKELVFCYDFWVYFPNAEALTKF